MKLNLNFVIFLILFSLNNVLMSQEDFEIFQFGEFIENSNVYLYADNVNIREKPSTNAKVVANLAIAAKVKIISKTDETLTLNGYNTCWYKVSFDVNGSKKIGYVWGGFLSAVTLNTTNSSGNNVTFLYSISEYKEQDGFNSCLKAVINGKIVSSIIFKPLYTDQSEGKYDYHIRGTIMANKGLNELKNIITLSYLYPACGYSNGDIIILWNGKNFIYGTEAISVFEAGIFSVTSESIFPTDPEGKSDKIIIKEKTINYDEEGNISSSSMKKIEYFWDGKKLAKQDND